MCYDGIMTELLKDVPVAMLPDDRPIVIVGMAYGDEGKGCEND